MGLARKIGSSIPKSGHLWYSNLWRQRAALEHLVLPEATVRKKLAETNIFFLLGSGRCGTMMLSNMLSRCPETAALHEPRRFEDLAARPGCRRDPAYARDYVRKFRQYKIYRAITRRGVKNFGEVSSPLRCVGGALKEVIPHAKMFILVRDPRDGIRSAMNRQSQKDNPFRRDPVSPLPGDPYAEKWESMDEFARYCWWWMDSYRTLLRDLPGAPIVHFEKVLGRDGGDGYTYVNEHIAKPIGLNLMRADYDGTVEKKSDNAAKGYSVSHWKDWNEGQRRVFDELCAETARRLGYQM